MIDHTDDGGEALRGEGEGVMRARPPSQRRFLLKVVTVVISAGVLLLAGIVILWLSAVTGPKRTVEVDPALKSTVAFGPWEERRGKDERGNAGVWMSSTIRPIGRERITPRDLQVDLYDAAGLKLESRGHISYPDLNSGETGQVQIRMDNAYRAVIHEDESVIEVREAAARIQSENNLKQISLALINYSDTNGGCLPPAAVYSQAGKPLLSWRVAILPFIEQVELSQRFRLDEPWDSPNNKPLLALMPKTYQFPKDIDLPSDHTVYRVFEGPGAAFEGRQGLRYPGAFLDGTSKTILVVEADRGVPWTKPDELAFDPNQPVTPVRGHFLSGFKVALADGSVRLIDQKVNERTLRAAITRNGGDIVGPDW
jgi:hypothetical protein